MSFKCRVVIGLLGLVPVLGIAQTNQQTGSSTQRQSGSQTEPQSGTRSQSGQAAQSPGSSAGSQSTQSQGSSGSGSMSSSTGQTGSGTVDQAFISKAAMGGMAEVELGRLAQRKASSKEVKDLAGKIVSDHTRSNEELQRIAKSLNVTIPTTVDSKHKDTKERLQKLSGTEFDRTFMNEIVNDHREHIAEFKREANSGNNQQVKQFASKTLPTLEEHLRQAEQTLQSVGGSQTQGLQGKSGGNQSSPGGSSGTSGMSGASSGSSGGSTDPNR
jgi:putative membrane protein